MATGPGAWDRLDGKVALVTGATSGIGKATARELARLGATVVLGARDPNRALDAKAWIEAGVPGARVEPALVGLDRLRSVREAAARVLASHARIDVLVNNAGVYRSERRLTEDGFEETFQVNHLAPYLLTRLLLDRVVASAPSRVVNVASEAHRGSRGLDFGDLANVKGRFNGILAYTDSKLMNVLFARELARRLEGTGAAACALHPGSVRSNWARQGVGVVQLGKLLATPFLISPERSARRVADASLRGENGAYYVRGRAAKPTRFGRDADAARRLWDASASLVGLPP